MTHNPIASWTPLVESSGASHIPAVRSGLPLSSWISAGVPCWEPAPDITSTVDAVCVLLTQPCGWYRPPDVQHSVTVPSQWLRAFGTCVEQPAVVCQECTVADDYSGRRLTMTRRSWLYCTVYLLSARDYWLSALMSFLSAFLFNFVRCPCNVFDVIVSP